MSDFNVTNNPYNMWHYYGYSYPQFRGTQVQPPVSAPTSPPANKPDTVSFRGNESSNNKGKNGLSTGAKRGIGLGLSALVAIGIGIATKGRVKNPKQVVQSLEFKPATTLDSAKKYAEDKLGVHYHEINDIEVINYFNEWLTGIHNKCTVINKGSYPKFIAENNNLEEGVLACMYDSAFKVGQKEGYVLGFNMDMIRNFEKFLNNEVGNGSVISKTKNGIFKINNTNYDTDFVRGFVERINNYNPKTTTFKEKMTMLSDINRINNGRIVNGKLVEANCSDYHYLNHELGHLRHQEIAKNYEQMKKVEEYKGRPVSDITKEFVSNKQIQETAGKVSDYAKESPLEFVAETFADLIEGKKLPDDVMALYKKYGGPAI